jgi:hypothetical protein
LQVAADRKTSSYVLCRDGRQAQLLADPSPTMTPTPGGRARDATSSQGIVPDSSPPRRHGANGAHRPGPGPAALHPPPHPTDPACSRPEVAPAALAEPGRHVPRCRPNRHDDANQGRVRPLTALPEEPSTGSFAVSASTGARLPPTISSSVEPAEFGSPPRRWRMTALSWGLAGSLLGHAARVADHYSAVMFLLAAARAA